MGKSNDLTTVTRPRLDKTALNSFGDKVSESEIYTVLKNMKNKKSPGSDEFTVEFFLLFLERP
jgi:hypothetical protein